MAFARVYSAQTELLSGRIVSVEIDTARGLNNFTIVGLGDRAVGEARDRVGSALKNAGFESPKTKNQKTVVSLSPAGLRKEGAHFDLSIALGFLIAEGLHVGDLSTTLFVGELGLDGVVRPVRGVLAIATAARAHGFRAIFVPRENAAEAALAEGLAVYGVDTLRQLVDHLTKNEKNVYKKIQQILPSEVPEIPIRPETDFSDIAGQESAKRGLLIAAAGGHNVIMHGPPGTGKTLLARAMASILPQLSHTDALEVTSILSIAGQSPNGLQAVPPFRAPHHTSSYVSVIGGGAAPKPGEITLAHKGVLFLDEFPEFDRRVLEGLREPLEERSVSISRSKGAVVFPADFLLVAAMNPCPCGWKGSKTKPCVCMPADLLRYKRKLSGPLLDRIDISLHVAAVSYEKLAARCGPAESENLRERVSSAREKAFARAHAASMPGKLNACIQGKEIQKLAPLSPEAELTLRECAERLGLSARAYHRTQRLARTIADVDGAEEITRDHILEAIRYRPQIETF